MLYYNISVLCQTSKAHSHGIATVTKIRRTTIYICKYNLSRSRRILTLLVMIRGGFDGKVCFSKTKIWEKRVSALFFEHVPIWKEAQISQLYHTCQDKINLAMVIAKIVFLYMVSFCINDSRARKRLFLQLPLPPLPNSTQAGLLLWIAHLYEYLVEGLELGTGYALILKQIIFLNLSLITVFRQSIEFVFINS